MGIAENLKTLKNKLQDEVTLVAVSKTHPPEKIMEAYKAGQRDFGENKVQELLSKKDQLPADIRWHLIGHLQTNKVKYIAGFVHLIHSVDSEKLAREIDKEGRKAGIIVNCLLQVHIAKEETKFGLSEDELRAILKMAGSMPNLRIRGLMGMATNTETIEIVRKEFSGLKQLFDRVKEEFFKEDRNFDTLSMGMSSDYQIAIEEGSTIVRVGSLIFGEREYPEVIS